METLYGCRYIYQGTREKYLEVTTYKDIDLRVLVSQDKINEYWIAQIGLFSYIPSFEDAPFDGYSRGYLIWQF